MLLLLRVNEGQVWRLRELALYPMS